MCLIAEIHCARRKVLYKLYGFLLLPSNPLGLLPPLKTVRRLPLGHLRCRGLVPFIPIGMTE